jgi:hypothetical protein
MRVSVEKSFYGFFFSYLYEFLLRIVVIFVILVCVSYLICYLLLIFPVEDTPLAYAVRSGTLDTAVSS